MQPIIFLFDIDGTLISSGGVARQAIEQAFLDLYGTTQYLPVSFGGMTDRAIVQGTLASLCPTLTGPALHAEVDRALDSYLQVLGEAARTHAARFRVQPGIFEVLDWAASLPNAAIGLGTGNVQRGARIKLEVVSLFDRFEFGGFGCDHIDRARLLAVGAERGSARLKVPLADCRVVVIGDTPKDVAAAHAIGAECVAVATGASSRSELEATGAAAVFDDLTDPAALTALLQATRGPRRSLEELASQ